MAADLLSHAIPSSGDFSTLRSGSWGDAHFDPYLRTDDQARAVWDSTLDLLAGLSSNDAQMLTHSSPELLFLQHIQLSGDMRTTGHPESFSFLPPGGIHLPETSVTLDQVPRKRSAEPSLSATCPEYRINGWMSEHDRQHSQAYGRDRSRSSDGTPSPKSTWEGRSTNDAPQPRGHDTDTGSTDTTNATASACADSKLGSRRRRVPHKVVERRYRHNLNERLEQLRDVLPSLVDEEIYYNDDGSIIKTRPPSKGAIITAAIAYIEKLTSENAKLLSIHRAHHGPTQYLRSHSQ